MTFGQQLESAFVRTISELLAEEKSDKVNLMAGRHDSDEQASMRAFRSQLRANSSAAHDEKDFRKHQRMTRDRSDTKGIKIPKKK